MDTAKDQVMNDASANTDSYLPLSDDEARALELYEKLQQLRLEIAIINAQKIHENGISPRRHHVYSHAVNTWKTWTSTYVRTSLRALAASFWRREGYTCYEIKSSRAHYPQILS